MAVAPEIFAVFGHFQNLNLLGLLQDLRDGRTTRHAWLSGSLLCPVAHGLPHGIQVMQLRFGQVGSLGADCDFAARHLGADPTDVFRFVQNWDDGAIDTHSLIRQLDELWHERLADAEAVQQVLHSKTDCQAEHR